MANGITLSAGVRANLLSLQNTAQLMQTTQNRLATGKKVNSALDNPINFFTSQSLQSRAGDLNSLLDSMSNGIQTIQAANNGLTSITSTVQSMQSALNQARQDSSWQSAAYTIDAAAIGTGSVKNLSFSGGAVTGTVNIPVNSITTAGTQSTLSTTASYLAPSVANPASVQSGPFYGLTGASTYTFKVNGQDITLTSASTGTQAGDTLAHAKDSIQAQLDTRFGAGSFTVGSNIAGDGFSIIGRADGTNDVNISNQAGTGAAAHQATVTGPGAYTALTGGDTYSFQVNGQVINLDDGSGTAATDGSSIAAATTAIQTQLNAAFGAGNFTVTNDGTNITIAGLADGSNSVSITNQAAVDNGGGAVTADLGFGTVTLADTGAVANNTSGLGLGSTPQTSYGIPADPYEFTVNGTSVTVAAGTGLAAAISSINTQLGVAHKFEAFDDGGQLGIREKTAEGTTLTIGGPDATSLFGATLTDTGTATGTASVRTVDQLVAAINANPDLAGKVKAINDSGTLRITNLSLTELTLTGATATAIDGGVGTQTIAGNHVRKGLVQQFNTLRDQLNKYATDASYNGINLLSGDNLRLMLNESGSSNINIQARDENGDPLIISATSLNIDVAQNSDFDSNDSINDLVLNLTKSLATLRSQGSAFGLNLSTVQNRQDFTKAMINTLQTGADNLVLADTNEEGANLLALQTRQSLSTTALSLSAQADQAVLSLFQ